jgi:hypothetical protein
VPSYEHLEEILGRVQQATVLVGTTDLFNVSFSAECRLLV